MIKFCVMLLVGGLYACNDNSKDYIEIADAPIQYGVRLKIGKPVLIYKNDFFSSESVPLEVANLSNDTIYFANIFVFKNDHPGPRGPARGQGAGFRLCHRGGFFSHYSYLS